MGGIPICFVFSQSNPKWGCSKLLPPKLFNNEPDWFQTGPNWYKMVEINLQNHLNGSGITRSHGLVFLNSFGGYFPGDPFWLLLKALIYIHCPFVVFNSSSRVTRPILKIGKEPIIWDSLNILIKALGLSIN